MRFELLLFKWIVWTLVFSMILGGTPWKFPAQGRYWLDALFSEIGLLPDRPS